MLNYCSIKLFFLTQVIFWKISLAVTVLCYDCVLIPDLTFYYLNCIYNAVLVNSKLKV